MATTTHASDVTSTADGAAPSPARIRVLLVAGHALFRQAVRVSLEEATDIEVIGEIANLDGAASAAARLKPDVMLLDASGSDGAARTTMHVRTWLPSCSVVVLGDEDPEVLIDVVEMGAAGYLTQESALADLIATTRAVHAGQTLIPQDLVGPLVAGLLERRRREHEVLERLSRLTVREREVLELLAEGANNQGIARALSISPETARTHVQNLLSKLGVHSRLEAAAFVLHARSFGAPADARPSAGVGTR